MTCIAGTVYKGKVYIGGDSAAASGYQTWIRKDPKVFKVGKFVIGNSGSPRMAQLLQFNLTIDNAKRILLEQNFDVDVYRYMCTTFIDNVRKTLKAGGVAEIKYEVESGYGAFLIGIKDRLFTIHSDFQVSELTSENAAVGCGEDFALGSMYASKHLSPDIKPRELITTALKAATEYSSYVRPPYIILST